MREDSVSKQTESTERTLHCRVPIATYQAVLERSARAKKPKLQAFVREIIEQWLDEHQIEESGEQED